MGAREAVAKAMQAVLGRRTDLPTRVYHGSGNFKGNEFVPERDVHAAGSIDRALGAHVAPDPALAGSFADKWMDKNYMRVGPLSESGGAPQVLPLRIPGDEKMLVAPQPKIYADDPRAIWRAVRNDTQAIEDMTTKEALLTDPDLLAHYLRRQRGIVKPEAHALSRAIVDGGKAKIRGGQYENDLHDLDSLIRNFRVVEHDPQNIADTARHSWEDKGYAGIKYINTAPLEAGAKGVKDPTSYIVFNPKNMRSEFAKFADDPESMASSNLLRGVVAAPVGLGTLYDDSKYEEEPK